MIDQRPAAHDVPLGEALKVWAYIALNSFGGPAGQIAVMHRVLVDTRHWISEQRFLHALNYCMLLPGPEAQQLSVYVGWLMHGVRGGLLAGLFFILPGFVAILALSILYVGYLDQPVVAALFYGLKAGVLAVVAAAVVRLGRRSLRNAVLLSIAAASFVALFFLDIPFPMVILAAGVSGLLGSRYAAHRFALPGHGTGGGITDERASDRVPILDDRAGVGSRPSGRRALVVLVVGGLAWLGPVAVLLAVLGGKHVLAAEAVFFSGAAVVSFGGAYAVLAYVAQEAVQVFGWVTPTEMLDGLAMAETTPGPLIKVVGFVGFLGAFGDSGALDPMIAGTLGAIVVTWVTFAPSFLLIFFGAPYAEYLRGRERLTGALSGITAAVVGAILNLAVWFALHAVFGTVTESRAGPVRLFIPDPSTFDPGIFVIAVGAFIAVFRLRIPLLAVLAASAAVGAAWFFVSGGPPGG